VASKKKPFDYFERRDEKRKLKKAKKNLKRHRDPKPPRKRDWLGYTDGDDDIDSFERIMPADEGDRRRQVENFAPATGSVDESVADDIMIGITGRVLEVNSGLCRVLLDGETRLCSLRGSLTAVDTGFSSVVAVGDTVQVTPLEAGRGIIEAIHPRHNQIARADTSGLPLQQVFVANIHQLLIVSAWRNPAIWTELIDRYLITAQRTGITPLICVNKLDLASDAADVDAAMQPYRSLGYTVLLTSVEQGVGIDALREHLRGKISAVAGLSGVGKSSLLSAVQPGFELRTGDVNEERGQGRHTTTQAVMMPFGDDGFVIDTAGIREFGLADLLPAEVGGYYPEMLDAAERCRFHDCLHLNEPDCAVQAAVESGAISPQRYHNYCLIVASLQ